MADPFLAEIRAFPSNFAPQGWALCDGQILSISEHTALFSLLGTRYGGDGKSTFALPDLSGRVPIACGERPNSDCHIAQGQNVEGTDAVAGKRDASVGSLTLNFIIALEGEFPSRS